MSDDDPYASNPQILGLQSPPLVGRLADLLRTVRDGQLPQQAPSSLRALQWLASQRIGTIPDSMESAATGTRDPLRLGQQSMIPVMDRRDAQMVMDLGPLAQQGFGMKMASVLGAKPVAQIVKQSLTGNSTLDAGIDFVSQIEKLAEKHGNVFLRWSPSSSGDLSGLRRSRDFVSGETHPGLSAVEITGDMHPVDIASRLSEYSFLRMQDPASRPRVYLGNKIGVDSDGYASIRPTQLLAEPSDDVMSAIDKKLPDVMDSLDNIQRETARLEINPGHPYITERLNAAKASLSKLLGK